jgi:N-acetylglucosaminyldiphosphoundecaprenol N-acetyl-beta-D-mannosaminyltransferase
MGVPIDALTEQAAVERIIGDWRHGLGGWVVTPNLDQLRILWRWPELKDLVAAHATLLLADGMPLVWASKIQGTPLPGRVAGSELILSLTTAAAEAGASIFLLGGSAGAGEKAAEILVRANPRLKIAGILSPKIGFERDPDLVAAIKGSVTAAKPDLVYTCLGFPKQELLIQQLKEHLPRSWFLGLGGSLSMISGEFSRAPVWMRQGGLEWLCRLAQEPRRLFKRYIIQDAPFALRLLGSSVWCRRGAVRNRTRSGPTPWSSPDLSRPCRQPGEDCSREPEAKSLKPATSPHLPTTVTPEEWYLDEESGTLRR